MDKANRDISLTDQQDSVFSILQMLGVRTQMQVIMF